MRSKAMDIVRLAPQSNLRQRKQNYDSRQREHVIIV